MSEYIPRDIEPALADMARWFPVVAITGPRQSGKSTVALHAYASYASVNLEDPAMRREALDDPISFLRNRGDHLIIDEAQYVPDIFSMVQVISDERGAAGQYILTGSQNFLMLKSIGQSLAGRVGVLTLLPFSFGELQNSPHPLSVDELCFTEAIPVSILRASRLRYISPAIWTPTSSEMSPASSMCATNLPFARC